MFSQGESMPWWRRARLAQAWLDAGLAREVEMALGKILSVLPPAARVAAEAQALYAPSRLGPACSPTCRRCARRCTAATWCRSTTPTYGRPSLRRLRPLGCFYWGKV